MNKGEWREVKTSGGFVFYEYRVNGACFARVKTGLNSSIYAKDEFFARIMPDSERSALLDFRCGSLEEMMAHVEKTLELIYINMGGHNE